MEGLDNQTRFFYSRMDAAEQLFRDGNPGQADDICRYLVAHFVCPKLIQVQARQLQSLCTEKYYDARWFLVKAQEILEALETKDDLVKNCQKHTTEMLDELDQIWAEKWKTARRDPPTVDELKESARVRAEEREADGEEEELDENNSTLVAHPFPLPDVDLDDEQKYEGKGGDKKDDDDEEEEEEEDDWTGLPRFKIEDYELKNFGLKDEDLEFKWEDTKDRGFSPFLSSDPIMPGMGPYYESIDALTGHEGMESLKIEDRPRLPTPGGDEEKEKPKEPEDDPDEMLIDI